MMRALGVFNTNLGFHALQKFGPKFWFHVASQYLVLSEGIGPWCSLHTALPYHLASLPVGRTL